MKYTITILTAFICFTVFSFTQAQTRSFKRGLGYNALLTEDVASLSTGVSWGYNWGHSGSGNDAAFATYNMEFIPMAWNGINKTVIRNYLSQHPEIKYILGFNEPNFKDQANLTPAEAAAKWPDVEEIADEFGLTIVGPALNYSPNPPYEDPIKWYDEFFQLCPDCRVDHIAVHFYMSSAGAIKSNVEKFKKYGRPIWLTEFCAWDNNTSAASQKRFMIEALDYLENDPDVYRYAWFKERGWSDGHPFMQLLDRRYEGVLKDLGAVFVHMSSYDKDFYFTTEQRIPAEHYIQMKSINMEKTSDESGNINLCDMNAGASWTDYNVNVPEDGEYNLFFRVASEYPDNSVIYFSVDGTDIATAPIDNKEIGLWNTQSCKATLRKGQQKIRLGFKSGGVKVNWLAISVNGDAPSSIGSVNSDNNATVYPNPVKDMLYIQSADCNTSVSLFDIYGKCVYKGKNPNTIDMSAFTSGMYILNIQNENGGRTVEKILKED